MTSSTTDTASSRSARVELWSWRDVSAYASTLKRLNRHDEVKTLMRKTLPVARRALGDSNDTTLRTRSIYAHALYMDDGATLDDLRESLVMLIETARTARRVLGGTHPLAEAIEEDLQNVRGALAARETPRSG